MCGIVCVYNRNPRARVDGNVLQAMTDRLYHRGPDAGGTENLGAVGLGHRRLAVIDLRPEGRQPMRTADRRWWITFNGEIYNFQELARDIVQRGARLETGTDTEVLLHLLALDGPACLNRLNGMFAFAAYDSTEHRLILARDRVGKKPLYIWDDGERLLATSELKAFGADPAFHPDIDHTALADYFALLHVPEPRTIYRQVYRLQPGTFLELRPGSRIHRPYWTPRPSRSGPGAREGGSLSGEALRRYTADAVEEFNTLFTDAVRLRLISDVPLGALLSGGLDSSAVVAVMTSLMDRPVQTATIGFEQKEEDESGYAAQVASHLACEHVTRIVPASVVDLLPRVLQHFDEPFADASALPTYCLTQTARQRVTVALTGDGADEVFAGYPKYGIDLRERAMRGRLPLGARGALGMLARRWPSIPLAWWSGRSPASLSTRTMTWLGRHLDRAGGLMNTLSTDPLRAYHRSQSFADPGYIAQLMSPELKAELQEYDRATPTLAAFGRLGEMDALGELQGIDLQTSFPGDMLVKMDRMAMAHGVEVRCPFLDHRLIEFGLGLPAELRFHEGVGKRIVRTAMAGRLPDLVNRPKHGLTIPVDTWLRHDLKARVEDTVVNGGPVRAGLLDRRAVQGLVSRHRAGDARCAYLVWSLMVLGVWYDEVRIA